MAWNSTVTCSYCYNTGHNRRGCDTLKEYIAANPDSYQAQRAAIAKKRSKRRTCSYCTEVGHNRRTCEQIAKDRTLLTGKLNRQRVEMLERMVNNGLGVGALIKRGSFGYNSDEMPWILISIEWEGTEGGGVHLPLRVRALKVGGDRYPRAVSIYFGEGSDDWHKYDVLSCVSEESIRASVPDTWLNGSLYDSEQWFPSGEIRPYWARDEESFLDS
tara:strand:- start:1782 stop:2429 length:648 start_codon:yes stop_codon:yes gene_type:complete